MPTVNVRKLCNLQLICSFHAGKSVDNQIIQYIEHRWTQITIEVKRLVHSKFSGMLSRRQT